MNIIYPDINFFINECETYSKPILRISTEWWRHLDYAINTTSNINNIKGLTEQFCYSYLQKNKGQPWFVNKELIYNILNYIISDENVKLGVSTSQAFSKKGICSYPTKLPEILPNLNAVIDKLFYNHIKYSMSCWKYWAYTGEIHLFFEYLKSKNVFMVGPYFFKNLGKKIQLPNYTHIEIPLCDATKHIDTISKNIINIVSGNNNVILLQGGSTIPGIMRNIKQIKNTYMLDIGRAIDVYYYFDNIRKKTNNKFWGIWLDKSPPIWIKSKNIKIV